MKRVVLLRPDKAGDAIKTLPVLRALPKDAFQVHVVTTPFNHSLFEAEAKIKTHCLPPGWESQPNGQLRRWAHSELPKPVDMAVNLQCDSFSDTHRLLQAIPATQKASASGGFEFNLQLPKNSPVGRDETENIRWLVESALNTALSLERKTSSPILLKRDQEEATHSLGVKRGPWIGICPLAGRDQRTVPLERWKRLLSQLSSDAHSRIFLFGVPSDEPRLSKLAFCGNIQVRAASSFRALGAYLLHMDRLVAVDSGPLHLALSLGVPSLGLLSGGDAKRWFAHVPPASQLILRGRFSRFPSSREIQKAYASWALERRPPRKTSFLSRIQLGSSRKWNPVDS